ILLCEAHDESAGCSGEGLHAGQGEESVCDTTAQRDSVSREVCGHAREAIAGDDALHAFPDASRNESPGKASEPDSESDGAPAKSKGWKWNRANRSRACAFGNDSGLMEQLSGANGHEKREWFSKPLQGGRGIAGTEVWDRGGRFFPQQSSTEDAGRQKGPVPHGSWV